MGPWSHSHGMRSPGQWRQAKEIRMSATRGLLTAVATAALLATNAAAADYPDRPVKIVVPFAAGSGTDVVARAAAAALAKRMGVAVEVQNTVGSNGAVGTA